MKVYLDANILVAVFNQEYPLFSSAARVVSLSSKSFELYTSAVCLAIAFYFASKKYGSKKAKSKIALLIEHIHIASCGEAEAKAAAINKKVLDVEDGLQYYSAVHAGCTCIVTEDRNDFYFSEIEVLSSVDFLRKYVVAKK